MYVYELLELVQSVQYFGECPESIITDLISVAVRYIYIFFPCGEKKPRNNKQHTHKINKQAKKQNQLTTTNKKTQTKNSTTEKHKPNHTKQNKTTKQTTTTCKKQL